jgi:AraC-like DNA-binding protein
MSGDTLSDLLRAVRLRGALFYYVEGADPWVAEAPPSRELIPAVLPGVDHLIEFHGIAKGSCWVGIVGEEPLRLQEGDIVMFPQGDAHVIASAPGMRAQHLDRGLYYSPRPPQLPFALNFHEPGATTARLDGGGCDQATVVCGFLGCDARPFNPLLAALPRVLRLPAPADHDSAFRAGMLRTLVEESNRKRPGGEAVLERMSEMLFIQALRQYADTLAPEQTGWLAGMRDPSVGRAMALIHERPGEPWTIDCLSEEVGVSRSTLHERFVHYLGQPPVQYLAQWRMQLAAGRLRDSDAKVLEIALEVGYESEAAFARAFRRSAGESPAAWRRARRLRDRGRTGAWSLAAAAAEAEA